MKIVHSYVDKPNGLQCKYCKKYKKQIDNFNKRIAAKWNIICAEEQYKKLRKESEIIKKKSKLTKKWEQIEMFPYYLPNQED